MQSHSNPVPDRDLHDPDEDVKIFPPDFTLKKMIGENVDIKALFSEENIKKAEKVVADHSTNFLDWVKNDLTAMQQHYDAANANVAESKSAIEKLAHLAFVLKSQAGTFGYQLATAVAKSLDDFCTKTFQPKADHLLVVRKHLETLLVIFDKNIKGDGGALGVQLFSSLQTLIKKYETSKE